jgi:16S rRNA (cytosine1402-N4)-methyltransferase
MTQGSGMGSNPAAGGPARHIPVLLQEVVEALSLRDGMVICDGTFGAGGYSKALLDAAQVQVVAIDRDPSAVTAGRSLVEAYNGRLHVIEGPFGQLDDWVEAAGFPALDGVVLDIGVSSMQIDEAGRGFSFRQDGPLDMRMAMRGRSAADWVNDASEEALADVFYYYGEERKARPVARAIVRERRLSPIETTGRLATIVASVVRAEPGGVHPATRVFQALRIAVNDELGELVRALGAAERMLKPDGRLVVVTFHSLEDRIVKQFLAERSGRGRALSRHLPGEMAMPDPTFGPVTRKPVEAGREEVGRNPRARSAKLRAAIRLAAPARSMPGSVTQLVELPSYSGGRR